MSCYRMRTCIIIFIFAFGAFLLPPLAAQDVYQHVSYKDIYSFLDELASRKVIELNSVVKPYSRRMIALKLQEAAAQRDKLNPRQQRELEFFLRDYNKELKEGKDFDKRLDLFYYDDSLFTLSVNPILGIQYWDNGNGSAYHRWNGGEAFAYVGNHVGVYASLRDNHETEKLSDPAYMNLRTGANYKAQYDFSEMRGGLVLSWEWGSLGLLKDHFEWGDYYRYPNIFSAKTPSMPHINLQIDPVPWFSFDYIHAWMVSEVTDSARSQWYTNAYGTHYREVFKPKFMSANLFTFRPVKHLSFSVGNAIVYSDIGLHPGYMIPFLFYKSVDHTLNSTRRNQFGQNSQMFLNLSSRNIRNVHLYGSLFIDELAVSRFGNDSLLNFFSYRYGMQLANVIPNVFLTWEYTRTNPLVYKHDMPTTTFESNFYSLGHYLQDNAREYHLALAWKPYYWWKIHASFTLAQKGPDHTSLGTPRVGIPFMEEVVWERRTWDLGMQFTILNDVHAFISATHIHLPVSAPGYNPDIFSREGWLWSIGGNVGF